MNIKLILRILSVIFLIKTLSNYNLILFLTKVEFIFWLQYVGVVGILCYFIFSILNIYGSFTNKKWVFISFYLFIICASLLTDPVLPIPYGYFKLGIHQASFIWSVNIISIIFIRVLQVQLKKNNPALHRTARGGFY
jgi:hypothetical protein